MVKIAVVGALVLALCGGCATTSKPFPIVEVAPGVFEGCKPKRQSDFEALKKHGVRTILSLQTLPWNVLIERHYCKKNGIVFYHVPIPATPLQPSEKRVEQALRALHDSTLHPIYIHCLLGFDRTTFIVGLYRIYYEGWTPQDAWEEMLLSGFHVRRSLRGFDTYFWSHTQRPDWVKGSLSSAGQASHGR